MELQSGLNHALAFHFTMSAAGSHVGPFLSHRCVQNIGHGHESGYQSRESSVSSSECDPIQNQTTSSPLTVPTAR